MKSNEALQKDVQDAIKYEPLLNAAEIGVIAKDGVITLTGIVDSYDKKAEAESAAKGISGVKAVVEKIEIRIGNTQQKNDNEIADEVLNAFKWNWEVPSEKVKVKVEDSWIFLEGELNWNCQKEAAKKAVSKITGVKGISNNITIKSESHDQIEKKDIENAFARNSSLDDKNVKIKVSGNSVTLNGTVNSWYQKDEAGRIAWNAPGVWAVDNELVVDYLD